MTEYSQRLSVQDSAQAAYLGPWQVEALLLPPIH